MTLIKKKKTPTVADIPIKFRPYRRDFEVIDSIAKAEGKDRPDIVRIIVSDWIRNRNLKAVGKDETLDAVVSAQKNAMNEALTPLFEMIGGLEKNMRRMEGRFTDEFDHSQRQLKFISLCARFIVKEVLICRLLLRDYVHTIYRIFVEKVTDRPAKELEKNFNARVELFSADADQKLEALTETTLGDLHDLAERKSVLLDEPQTAAKDPQKS